ncbi:MAG: FHA domain-containing protein [Planctomycetes bacterium]|nr:FHA domain-containing protein [Planctomycetota bacterium]
MEIKLIVTTGKYAGKAVPVKRNKFFIGRASDCHLRAGGDAISRHHCAILQGKGIVVARDLGSRTGTFVNDTKIEKQRKLKTGDRLRVGPLEFEVSLSSAATPAPKPAAKPAPKPAGGGSEADVMQWLDESPPKTAAKLTSQVATAESEEAAETDDDDRPVAMTEEDKEERRTGRMIGVSKTAEASRTSDTSQNAAADAMKKFFGSSSG